VLELAVKREDMYPEVTYQDFAEDVIKPAPVLSKESIQ
jgi:hypothetical protein